MSASVLVRYTSSRLCLVGRSLPRGSTWSPRSVNWTTSLRDHSRRAFSQTSRDPAKRFTESHEWIDVAQDGKTCTVGISNYAAEALGDVVFVELPSGGDPVSAGEAFGTVESVKSASDIVSPVSGTVSAVNDHLEGSPADLSKEPEGSGWLVKIEGIEGADVESLMDQATYETYIKSL